MAFEECCFNARKKGLKGKIPDKDGIAPRLRKKKRKAGKKATKWQNNGKRSNIWKTQVERRRMEGSSLKLDVMQKVPELLVLMN